jgi:hypothetical protein
MLAARVTGSALGVLSRGLAGSPTGLRRASGVLRASAASARGWGPTALRAAQPACCGATKPLGVRSEPGGVALAWFGRLPCRAGEQG